MGSWIYTYMVTRPQLNWLFSIYWHPSPFGSRVFVLEADELEFLFVANNLWWFKQYLKCQSKPSATLLSQGTSVDRPCFRKAPLKYSQYACVTYPCCLSQTLWSHISHYFVATVVQACYVMCMQNIVLSYTQPCVVIILGLKDWLALSSNPSKWHDSVIQKRTKNHGTTTKLTSKLSSEVLLLSWTQPEHLVSTHS